MECNKDEAQRAKGIAKKKFEERDLQGARKFALKAQTLFPGLEGIDQMIATFDIYLASVPGDKDWYSILSVPMNAGDEEIKKQYKKLALQFHPSKNKSVGAEGAFQMVQEAYMVLSDITTRAAYDQKRNVNVSQQRTVQSSKASTVPSASNDFYNFAANAATASKPIVSKQTTISTTHGLDAPPLAPSTTTSAPVAQPNTFWTSCNNCKWNYQHLRMYLNQILFCHNCRELFLAKEVQSPPTGNVVQDSNVSGANGNTTTKRNLDEGPFSRAVGVASATTSSVVVAQAANVVHQTHEKVRREREKLQAVVRREEALRQKYNHLKRHGSMSQNANIRTSDETFRKKTRTMAKDAKVGSSSNISGPRENCFRASGGNGGANWKPRPMNHLSLAKTFSQMDLRGLLKEKAKNELKNKLSVIKSKTSQVVASEKVSKKVVVKENGGDNEALVLEDPTTNKDAHDDPEEIGANSSTNTENEGDDRLSYYVPDPDFYDFDKNRTEECFQSDQIWASYDYEDGMPRHYAFIQKVLSLKPFNVRISYLTPKTNSKFGPLNLVSSGFKKTCGDFKIGKYESCDIVNVFSHQMKWEKGLSGIIKIYPQKGDIWVIYKNWSPDWDEDTPDNVLHSYNVIEVLDAYDEEHGISIIPLVKVTGFQTVFQRHQDPNTTMKIPKEEMFRFSHQVPFYKMSGEEALNVPKDCYELDPAAIPKELLQGITKTVEANGTSTVD